MKILDLFFHRIWFLDTQNGFCVIVKGLRSSCGWSVYNLYSPTGSLHAMLGLSQCRNESFFTEHSTLFDHGSMISVQFWNFIYKPHSCQPCLVASFRIKHKKLMIGRFTFIFFCSVLKKPVNTVFKCRIQSTLEFALIQCLPRQETFTI